MSEPINEDIIVSMVITYGGLACPATFEIDGALLGVTPTPVEFIHGEMLPYVEAIWNRITQTAQQMGRTLPASKRAEETPDPPTAPPTKEADHE